MAVSNRWYAERLDDDEDLDLGDWDGGREPTVVTTVTTEAACGGARAGAGEEEEEEEEEEGGRIDCRRQNIIPVSGQVNAWGMTYQRLQERRFVL
jgi:hypothetical protein